MGYGMLLFIFENLASSGVAFSFLFFISGCYFDHFLLSTHISLASCLWKATFLPMREDDLAHVFCINYGGTLCGALGLFSTL